MIRNGEHHYTTWWNTDGFHDHTEKGATVMTARLGTVPTTAERVELLERQLAEALERIAVLESARDVDEQIDGAAPVLLGPSWRPIKAAAALVGYSESALRKASKGGRAVWWQARGCRILIDIDRCPRRV
jgi:hypothetical protein